MRGTFGYSIAVLPQTAKPKVIRMLMYTELVRMNRFIQ